MIDVANGEIVESLRMPPRRFGEVSRPAPRPSFWLRVFRFTRALVRQRQETAALRETRKDAEAQVMGVRMEWSRAERQFNEQKQKLEITISDLQYKLSDRERILKQLNEVEIPKRDNEIKVLKRDIELLDALYDKAIGKIEADIATYAVKVTDAQSAELSMRGR